jgi:hypothetical protein
VILHYRHWVDDGYECSRITVAFGDRSVELLLAGIQRDVFYLEAHPAAALTPPRRAAHDAVLSVLGPERFTEAPADVAK